MGGDKAESLGGSKRQSAGKAGIKVDNQQILAERVYTQAQPDWIDSGYTP
ncbi:uncharacterized protein EURHEDRAFT_416240 [Aspergillus ruber CBS 135680]|uniref:Uncharacterized protein n=1 Tax=Aspergillus ruber (strain CBS 135680) TaxID=1388766 RepID=A0A017S609_ASPRC|nr:uncharacterized protein EURHEDRAFT_416240 [Aspergillus ruber CBS 135680]EYE91570.1 hypothetical protein EURHEDRAFT_416240 [Aspergillus ruber CBS 135680]